MISKIWDEEQKARIWLKSLTIVKVNSENPETDTKDMTSFKELIFNDIDKLKSEVPTKLKAETSQLKDGRFLIKSLRT